MGPSAVPQNSSVSLDLSRQHHASLIKQFRRRILGHAVTHNRNTAHPHEEAEAALQERAVLP